MPDSSISLLRFITALRRKAGTVRSLTWSQRVTRGYAYVAPVINSLLMVIYFVPAWLIARLNVRFLVLSEGKFNFGHLAHDPMLYSQRVALGDYPAYRAVLLAPDWKVPNDTLLQYWRPHFRIVSNRWIAALLEPLAWSRFTAINLHFDHMSFRDRHGTRYAAGPAFDQILIAYADEISTEPFMTIDPAHEAKGRSELEKLGIGPDDWWACLHVRESGYHDPLNVKDLFRDADPMTYLDAVRSITDRGGWVIRIGDTSMSPLPPMEKLIDFAVSETRSDWMDVFLIGCCRFLLSSDSGPNGVAALFERPVAAANYIPMSHAPQGSIDIHIPKMIRSKSDGSIQTFHEILLSKQRDFYTDLDYLSNGLEWVDNTEEDIKELATEMMDRLDGAIAYESADVKRQREYKDLWIEGATWFSVGRRSRIGSAFLRKYPVLPE